MCEIDNRHSGRQCAVLLVEDEVSVRNSLAEMLRDNGFTVHEAEDGPAALARANQIAEPIDVLVTDVSLPRMSGLELASCLRKKYPTLRIVFISGQGADVPIPNGETDCRIVFLEKPFRPTALLEKIGQVLQHEWAPR